MQVSIKGLVNRLDSLRERLNKLFDKLEKLDDLEQEEIAVEDVDKYFDNDDTLNLSVALDILEQVDKLDKVLDVIKEKNVDMRMFREEFVEQNNEYNFYLENYDYYHYGNYKDTLTQEEFDLLKEMLL